MQSERRLDVLRDGLSDRRAVPARGFQISGSRDLTIALATAINELGPQGRSDVAGAVKTGRRRGLGTSSCTGAFIDDTLTSAKATNRRLATRYRPAMPLANGASNACCSKDSRSTRAPRGTPGRAAGQTGALGRLVEKREPSS